MMTIHVYAERSAYEEAIELLHCDAPYMHTVSYEAMRAWEEEAKDTALLMNVTEKDKRTGIAKWDAAIQMFQQLYDPDNEEYMNSAEGKHQLDEFLLEGNMIPHVYHVIPEKNELPEDDARKHALNAICEKYNIHFGGLLRNIQVDTHYFTPTGMNKDAMWLFHVTLENGDRYYVNVHNGQVTECERLDNWESLFESYDTLCSEKGAFFTWSIEEKAAYAAELPQRILSAYMEGQDMDKCADLLAIAGQGFCLPGDTDMTQKDALDKAMQAAEEKYGMPSGWADEAEVYYSFFRTEDGSVWRVIFWKTGVGELPGAVVDMDAKSGEPFRVERYDGTPTSIPYRERL